MSRGGFGGGGRNIGGNMGGQKLPFDVDPDLEKEMHAYAANGAKDKEENVTQGFVWPEYPGGVPRADPVTRKERERFNIYREMTAARHAGPHYSGPPGTLERLRQGNKRSLDQFNAFEDQETYGKKFAPPEWKFPDPKKHKFAAPQLLPEELWEAIGYNPDDSEAYHNKKLKLNVKTIYDKLARFDDDDDEKGVQASDDEYDGEKGENDEDEPDGPQDDDFDEDEDDDGDDYNAEQYFDDGDEDVEEAGADEYAGDDGY